MSLIRLKVVLSLIKSLMAIRIFYGKVLKLVRKLEIRCHLFKNITKWQEASRGAHRNEIF